MSRHRRALVVALCVVLGIPLLLLSCVLLLSASFNLPFVDPFHEEYEHFRAVKVGMTEDQVRGLLGEPQLVYHKATAPHHYYVEGWSYKERPITNKVLAYLASEPIAYVYFDDLGRVEYVFVGGS